jgi:transposase InsO family protein
MSNQPHSVDQTKSSAYHTYHDTRGVSPAAVEKLSGGSSWPRANLGVHINQGFTARPRHRLHPPKPTVGVRAAAPNEIWHVDLTVLKVLDGTKAYLHAIIDNYSRKILAWTVAERLEPTATCQLLLAAGKHMVFAGRPLLFADSGIENINGAVDATLFSACLERVLAQVDVAYSNSMIEAFWRSLKDRCPRYPFQRLTWGR